MNYEYVSLRIGGMDTISLTITKIIAPITIHDRSEIERYRLKKNNRIEYIDVFVYNRESYTDSEEST